MKYFSSILFVCFLPFLAQAMPTADEVKAQLSTRPEMDQIVWKDPARGLPFRVRIVSVSHKELIVDKQLATGWTRRALVLDELGEIRFSPLPWETQTPAAAPLRVLWKLREPLLGKAIGVSESGISLAKALREVGTSEAWQEADAVLHTIIRDETLKSLQNRASLELKTLTFAKLLRNATAEEKEKRAWEITETVQDENPELMLLATAYLADLHYARLVALQDEHPRWMEDDEVKEARQQLYHLSIDLALYPSLFCGSRSGEASEGLEKVVRVYQLTQEVTLLKGTLEDLVALYPQTSAAKKLAPLLVKTESPPPVKSQPQQENPPPAAAPKPSTRYNLFKD